MTATSREAQQTSERLLIGRRGMKNAAPFCLILTPTLHLPGTYPPTLRQDPIPTTLSGCHPRGKIQWRLTPPHPLRCHPRRTRPQTSGPGPVQFPPTPTHSAGQDTAPGDPRLVTLARCTHQDKPPRTQKFLLLTSGEEYRRAAHFYGCT